ncbi:hypothetical protein OZX62_08430 [Bifidobacterium sp. ESL0690]|uniref:hypothetical protein n=1 Tax=Bifidobacterium sp. ESL0690 TaxID=2983214 RepID=UPI0023F73BD6|nr:hypothetical protein [Bifidobacterium sp. ESL0690]WEV46449.1 hypothetical protein OZX62_08430 [Bifidobacterium sp. ESL0690]
MAIMSDNYEENLLHDGCAPINLALPSIMEEASSKVEKGMKTMLRKPQKFRKQYANNLMSVIHELLEDSPIEDFTLDPHTDRIDLLNKEYGFHVRLNKSFAFAKGLQLAPAGHNLARQEAYTQGRLRTQEELEAIPHILTTDLLADDTLFITWNRYADGHFEMAAWKPLNAGSFTRAPKSSMMFPIGVSSSLFGKRFEPDNSTEEPILVPKSNLIEERIIEKDPIQHADAK